MEKIEYRQKEQTGHKLQKPGRSELWAMLIKSAYKDALLQVVILRIDIPASDLPTSFLTPLPPIHHRHIRPTCQAPLIHRSLDLRVQMADEIVSRNPL